MRTAAAFVAASALIVLAGCSSAGSEEEQLYTLHGTVKGKSLGGDPDFPSSCKVTQGVNDPVVPRMDVHVEIPKRPFTAHGMLGEGTEEGGDCVFHFTIKGVPHSDSAGSTYLYIGDVNASSIDNGTGPDVSVVIEADDVTFTDVTPADPTNG